LEAKSLKGCGRMSQMRRKEAKRREKLDKRRGQPGTVIKQRNMKRKKESP